MSFSFFTYLKVFYLANPLISQKFYIPYSGLFSRGKIFTNARCGDILRVKFSRMVNKELINNHTPIYFQGENIRE